MKVKQILICLVALAMASPAYAIQNKATADSLWTAGNNAYAQNQYQEALDSYLQIEKGDIVSAALYYNMGNCYFKLSYTAQSVIYYERALLLDPGNKDIAYNLELARQYCVDKIEPVPEFFVFTWTKNLMKLCTSDRWAGFCILFVALCAAFLLAFFFARSRIWRKTAFFASIICVLLAVFTGLFASYGKNAATEKEYAIVFSAVTSVKSSPDASGKDLLVVHEGTKVCVLEEVGQWSRVELADGRQGWLVSKEIVYL